MNKYPLDAEGVENATADILQNDNAQRGIIIKLCDFLRTALSYVEYSDLEWAMDAEVLLNDLDKRKMTFENLRFDQGNGHRLKESSPYPQFDPSKHVIHGRPITDGEMPIEVELTEEELAAHFSEPPPRKKESEKPVHKMSLEEMEAWEAKQNNSNDIYKLSARVKNLARLSAGGNLTPTGDMLANTYTHVLKSLYDFADTIEDKETKIKLIELIKTKEGMPADFMAAVSANVKTK